MKTLDADERERWPTALAAESLCGTAALILFLIKTEGASKAHPSIRSSVTFYRAKVNRIASQVSESQQRSLDSLSPCWCSTQQTDGAVVAGNWKLCIDKSRDFA